MKSRIRWGRVIAAAVLSEFGAISVLMVVTLVCFFLFARNRTVAEFQQLGVRTGYYVAPLASGLATFLSALWVTRRLTTHFVLNGTLVGIAAVILTMGFLFSARPEDRFMYVVSFILRIVAGYLAGLMAKARFSRSQSLSSSAVGQVG
jgi:dolichyl-phosphate-mannose--protein O-mannosyl transferase